jgi:hypothetical protein
MTGKGYHFVLRIDDATPVAKKLQTFGRILPSLEAKYVQDHPFADERFINEGM